MKKNILLAPLLLLLLSFVLLPSCRDEDDQRIPYTYVDFSIALNSYEFRDLNVVGGWVYVTGGYRGIILYHGSEGYIAYERACPYDFEKEGAVVEVDETGLFAVDPLCGSEFYLIDGYGAVRKGPAVRPLKTYRTSVDNGYLYVYN